MLILALKFIFLGLIATALMDISAVYLAQIFQTKTRNWGTVGQWLMGLVDFKWVYQAADHPQAPTRMQHLLGWGFHYVVGAGYGVVLMLGYGADYLSTPNMLAATLVGLLLSTLASWLIFMPCMGAGLFGHKVKNIKITVGFVLSLHLIFASGLYLPVSAGWV